MSKFQYLSYFLDDKTPIYGGGSGIDIVKLNDISKGELVQLNAINNLQLDLKELLRISYLKTGRLFEASAKCGAMLCTDNIKYIKLISESSRDIGTLFKVF